MAKVALAGVHDAHPYIGSSAVVVGLGVIGQLIIDLLLYSGVNEIYGIDLVKMRRKYVESKGVVGIDPSQEDVALKIKKNTKQCGVDVAIEVSGSGDGLNTAIRSVCVGGRVVTISTYTESASALNLGEEYHRNRIDLVSSMSVNNCHHRGVPLWDSKRLSITTQEFLSKVVLHPEKLISEEVSFDDLPDFYQHLINGASDHLAILVTY